MALSLGATGARLRLRGRFANLTIASTIVAATKAMIRMW